MTSEPKTAGRQRRRKDRGRCQGHWTPAAEPTTRPQGRRIWALGAARAVAWAWPSGAAWGGQGALQDTPPQDTAHLSLTRGDRESLWAPGQWQRRLVSMEILAADGWGGRGPRGQRPLSVLASLRVIGFASSGVGSGAVTRRCHCQGSQCHLRVSAFLSCVARL